MARARSDRLALAGVTLLAVVLFGMYLAAHSELSYVDEVQHFDYLERIAHGHLVARGQTLGRPAMEELACRGIDVPPAEYERFYGAAERVPACDDPGPDPSRFPEGGVNQVAVHPPVYYAVTGVLARIVQAITPIGSLLTAARVANLVWLLLAIAFLWSLLAEFSASSPVRAILIALVVTAPQLVQMMGSVSPDAAALAVGGALLLFGMRWERGAAPGWALPAAAGVAVAIKETNAIGVALVLLYLVIRGRRIGPRRVTLQALAVVIAIGVAAGTWLVIENAVATVPTRTIPFVARFQTDSIDADSIVSQVGAVVSPVRSWLPPDLLRSPATALHGTLLDVLFIGAAAAAAIGAARGSRLAALGGSEAAAMLVAGPAFVVSNYVLLHIFVVIPQRYGLSLVPGLVALITFGTEKRWLRAVLALICTLGVVALVQGAVTGS